MIILIIAIIRINMTNFDSSRCQTGCMLLTWTSAQWRQMQIHYCHTDDDDNDYNDNDDDDYYHD